MRLLRPVMNHRLNRHLRSGFTMIEIALCLAIIGFALVAIIGILPAGMQVQKDNREDTIINQDAGYWMEAIRNGSQDLFDLPNFVDAITIQDVPFNPHTNAFQIIGLLTTPGTTNYAYVRAISGAAAEKGSDPNIRDFAFNYRLRVEVEPFTTHGFRDSSDMPTVSSNLFELRLTFAWPVSGDLSDPSRLSDPNRVRIGNNRQTVRTLVSGRIDAVTNNTGVYYFFRPINENRLHKAAETSGKANAFSLVEVMVAVGLLAFIIVGLLAMFYQTQRAFRSSATQTDVLEAGRAAMQIIRQDLQDMHAAGHPFVTNFLMVFPENFKPAFLSSAS